MLQVQVAGIGSGSGTNCDEYHGPTLYPYSKTVISTHKLWSGSRSVSCPYESHCDCTAHILQAAIKQLLVELRSLPLHAAVTAALADRLAAQEGTAGAPYMAERLMVLMLLAEPPPSAQACPGQGRLWEEFVPSCTR